MAVELEGLLDPQLIGRGGAGEVYRAYQPDLDRLVAVKVLTAANDPSFGQEVSALGRIGDHPNIVQILSSGTTGDGHPYLVMPLYNNGTLQDRVSSEGPLSVHTWLRVGVKLCAALETAHRAGVVHGDIEPANVLLTGFDDVVLADFGVAQMTAAANELHGPC